ncbi:DUF4145 domain-containing protein [Priestia megaterium]|nr:DUF4145 domain-containing protein [Priestia megaterium]
MEKMFFRPEVCPFCKHSISAECILGYNNKQRYLFGSKDILCKCPRKSCSSLFFAVYDIDEHPYGMTDEEGNVEMVYVLKEVYPKGKAKIDFQSEIHEVSPQFIEIYNQAYHAEQEKLDLICGGAYRKALEYLIKDFVSYLQPDETERIQAMPLQQCVRNFIDQPDIKDMAERAIWLGNDETHYVRKWESKDIKDLKNLIDLTVFYISMNIKAKKYREEMAR